ncbi:hypothetical protein SK128_010391 [Halocaridina rubra]|uniref:Vezatin n=1 Tax=Halocaridina rubra TaxID=373956 RepID=A0AAN9AAG7_HALRR
MDEGNEDEDVVFEGSAIHQHLTDVGYFDYEVTQPVPCQMKERCKAEEIMPSDDPSFRKKRMLYAVSFLFWPEKIRRVFCSRIPRIIYNSKELNSDDRLILENFVPELFKAVSSQNDEYFILADVLVWIMIMVTVCFSLSSCICIFVATSLWSSVIIGVVVVVFSFIGKVSWEWSRKTKAMENCIRNLQESSDLILKSLKLLLEEDLIARGFVLAQGSSSFLSSNEKETPHCHALRWTLHNTLDVLLQHLPFMHDHFSVVACPHYPGMKGLFDDSIQMDGCMDLNSTEHLRLLKKVVTAVRIQISSILTMLFMCAEDVETFEKTCNMLVSLPHYLLSNPEEQICILSKHLAYAHSFWKNDAEKNLQEKSVEDKKTNIYIAIHSAILHMQSALLRAQDLRIRFEDLESVLDCADDEDDSRMEKLLPYNIVQEQLHTIQTELQACQSSLDETLARVERKYSIKTQYDIKKFNISGSEHLRTEEVSTDVTTKKLPIPLFDINPVIEDEVFEVYIDQEYCDNLERERHDAFWNTTAVQERKKIKAQKEQGKRVICELQPILTKLRGVWEKRESAALLKQKAEHCKVMPNDEIWMKKNPNNHGLQLAEIETTSLCLERKELDASKLDALIGREVHRDEHIHECIELLKNINSAEVTQTQFEVGERVEKHTIPYPVGTVEDVQDSDEERLELYRKVRMELNEDERSRPLGEKSISERYKEDNILPIKNYRNSHGEKTTLFMSESTFSDDGSQDSLEEHSDAEKAHSWKIAKDICKNHENASDIQGALSLECEKYSEKCTAVDKFKTETIPTKDLKEEVYVSGEDVYDDDAPRIDWDAASLSTRMTDTLEERLDLFCGSVSRGFHAHVAAEAKAASVKFLGNGVDMGKSYEGSGDGEECFGDTDSE